ncbi:MAG: HK97-gp10 family putative phage morphogenesis protein [Bellilinea sp.]
MNEIKLDTKELDRIAKQLNVKREAVGRRMAYQIEKRAKELAPKDTGALRNSIYTVTQKEDGYGKAQSATKSANSGVTTNPHPTPSGNIIANVGPCVDYAEYQEFGTSKMAAHPYLTPAVEEIAQKYNSGEEWKELVE